MSSTDARTLVVAVDIGGTFTDVSLQDLATGAAWTAKTPSTPHDPSEAFLAGVALALTGAGEGADRIGRVLHGTTVATNLILEGKTARTVLITTEGFRHVLEIGRQDIPRQANLFAWVKPRRPVPPSRVLEIPERIGAEASSASSSPQAKGPRRSRSASFMPTPTRSTNGARRKSCGPNSRASPSPRPPRCCPWSASTSGAWRRS